MRIGLLTLLVLSACKRAPEGPCAAPLGGDWVSATDSRFGYHLDDKGDELSGDAYQREPSGPGRGEHPSGSGGICLGPPIYRLGLAFGRW
jgi:hypothetical protein